MDRISPERRSANMRRIRGRNTSPEKTVRQMLHALGYRYRLHGTGLPGTPDLVFPGRKKVIFVHGCFWHRHEGCRYAYTPKSRTDFWLPKLEGNRVRDERNIVELERLGWTPLVIWECELKDREMLERRLVDFLSRPRQDQRQPDGA